MIVENPTVLTVARLREILSKFDDSTVVMTYCCSATSDEGDIYHKAMVEDVSTYTDDDGMKYVMILIRHRGIKPMFPPYTDDELERFPYTCHRMTLEEYEKSRQYGCAEPWAEGV